MPAKTHRSEVSIARLVAPFVAADRRARFRCAAALGLSLSGICGSALHLTGQPPIAAALPGLAVFVAATWLLRRSAPGLPGIARHIDHLLGTGDLLATALDQETRTAPPTVFGRALRSEALGLAPRLAGLPRRAWGYVGRWHNRALVTSGLTSLVAVLVIVGPPQILTVAPSGRPLVALPQSEDLLALAEILSDANDPEMSGIASELAALGQAMAQGQTPPGAAADLAALTQALRAAHGLSGDADPGVAISTARAEERLADWLGEEMAFSAGAEPGSRVAPRVTAGLAPRGGDVVEGEGPAQPQRMQASVSVDDLDISQLGSEPDSRPAPEPGQSPFIPPQLVEGRPQEGLAIDMEGTGDAPRRESLDATAGGDGAAPSPAQTGATPIPPGGGQDLVIIYSGITPRDTPIHYLTEADRGAEDTHAGATLGTLPEYPRLQARIVTRPGLRPTETAALIRAQMHSAEE